MFWVVVSAFAADPAKSSVVVEGTIAVDPARAAAVSGAKAVFVSVRDPAGGPPLSALKLAPGPFPLTFRITEADQIAMGGPGRPWPAKVDLAVRLDADGDPMTRDDGLPAATLPGTVKGTAGIAVTLK